MADATYQPSVYRKQGGNEQVVASGGKLTVESGGIIDVESGGYLKLDGTQVTATAAQLNRTAVTTPGTQEASKAIVNDANSNQGIAKVTALHIGTSGSETQVTATAAELNKIDGSPTAATFSIGAENTNAITVGVQLKDANGADLAVRGSVFGYLAQDANGDAIASATPTSATANGTDGLLMPISNGTTATKTFQLVSEADGDIDVVITDTAGSTYYLALVFPNGKLAVSNAITFAT